jgi:hypothetical protein
VKVVEYNKSLGMLYVKYTKNKLVYILKLKA